MRVVLPSSAADTTYHQAYFTTGRNNTDGASSITSPPKRRPSRIRIEKLERLVGRLTLESEFLKRGLQNSLKQVGRNGESSRDGNASSAVSGVGCRLMNIAGSSFYYKPRAKSRDQMKAEAELRDRTEAICLKFLRYGYRRVTHQLKHEWWQVNHKEVLRLMWESDLLCRVKRRWVKTTDSEHRFPRYPNLIKGVVISRLNQVWLLDITHIRIQTGFVYLSAILDAYSRRVIGYAISTSLDTVLTVKVLRTAITERWSGPGGHPPLGPGSAVCLG